MKHRAVARSFALLVAAACTTSQASAQVPTQAPMQVPQPLTSAPAALVLPVAGTSSAGGTFRGMLSLQRFATSNNQVVAVGMISGVVMDASGGPVGTVLSGPGQIQVALSQSGTASAPAPGTSAPQSCGVLHMQFGTVTLSALAVAVTTSPVVIDLAGEANATDLLGPLVCQTLGALTNVGTLVESLNQLLAVLGILTGGSILPV